MGDILRFLNEDRRDIRDCPISAESLAEMIVLIEDGTIQRKIAKEVSEAMYRSGKPPRVVIEERTGQITDEGALEKTIETVMAANPAQLNIPLRKGQGLRLFSSGQVMKATQGKANPQLVNDLLKKMLPGT